MCTSINSNFPFLAVETAQSTFTKPKWAMIKAEYNRAENEQRQSVIDVRRGTLGISRVHRGGIEQQNSIRAGGLGRPAAKASFFCRERQFEPCPTLISEGPTQISQSEK